MGYSKQLVLLPTNQEAERAAADVVHNANDCGAADDIILMTSQYPPLEQSIMF